MVSYQEYIFKFFPAILSALLVSRGKPEDSHIELKLNDLWNWVYANPDHSSSRELLAATNIESVRDEGLEKLKTNYVDQAFRAFCSLRQGFPEDQRCWDYASHLPERYMKTALWTCTFMLTIARERKRAGKTGFHTRLATPFERLLFLIAAKMIVDTTDGRNVRGERDGERATKRQRTSSSTSRLSKFSWTRDTAQSLGYAVQTVVRSWDVFVKSIGFSSTDSMVRAYISFDEDSLEYKPISTRAEGYSPPWQQSFLFRRPNAPDDVPETHRKARARGDDLDAKLRGMATQFLEDVRTVVLSKEVYSKKAGQTINVLQPFLVEEEQASRFDTMKAEVIDLLSSEWTSPLASTSPVKHPSVQPKEARGSASSRAVQAGPSRHRTHREGSLAGRTLQIPASELQVQAISCSGGRECECFEARQRLDKEMQAFVRIYDCSFNQLVQVDEVSSGRGTPIGDVQLILTDPPFNHRRESGRPNSEHDALTEEEMTEASDIMYSLLVSGGHAVIFCSPMQFAMWHKELSNVEPEEDEEDSQDENENGHAEAFLIDPHPVTLVNSPGHYHGNIQKFTTALFPVTSWAIHATKTGLTTKECGKLVDYSNHAHVSARHPGWTNVLDGIDRLRPGERLRRKDDKGRIVSFRPEQKSRAMLKELICRFSQPGALVADMFGGTFSTAAACLTLPKHRKFLGCEKDTELYIAARAKLVEVFAEAILHEDCDITFTEEKVLDDARLVVKHSAESIREDPRWRPPAGFPSFQCLPKYHLQYLAAALGLPNFATEFEDRPVSSWPSTLKGALQSTPMEQLQRVEASHLGLVVRKSTVKHPRAGEGLFASRRFEKGETVAFYYGCLVYRDLSSEGRKTSGRTKVYGEGSELGVTPEEFCKCSIYGEVQRAGITVGESHVKHVTIVPKEWCVGSKVNDPRYGEEDEERDLVLLREIPKRAPNVEFVRSRIRSMKDIVGYKCVTLVALRDIEIGEELFVDYGVDHDIL